MNNTASTALSLLGPPLFAILLSWSYLPRVGQLVDPGLDPFAKLLVVVGASAALYCWYFFFKRTLPWFLFDRPVDAAWARSDWRRVASAVERARRFGRGSDKLTAALGTAHANLHEWESALLEFSQIEGPIDDPEYEYGRFLNTSFCLIELGRIDEARAVFEALDDQPWPREMTLHMDEKRARLGGELPDRGRIH